MISVISCVSNLAVYEDMLKKSLEQQQADYELIFVDNTQHVFSSAAKALNHGAKLAKGAIVVFVHQDVSFDDPHFLTNIQNVIQNENVCVGVAGIQDEKGVISNIRQGQDHQFGGDIQIKFAHPVETLDEVLIALRKDVFLNQLFDEQVCDDWHLYGVELSLSLAMNGIPLVVLPLDLYHKSSGKISKGYIRSLYKVARKHAQTYQRIFTTCTVVPTRGLRFIQYIIRLYWDHVIVGR
jgi:hypothetical protein